MSKIVGSFELQEEIAAMQKWLEENQIKFNEFQEKLKHFNTQYENIQQEQSGYTQDVIAGEDILMRGLDFAAINLGNNAASSAEKRCTNSEVVPESALKTTPMIIKIPSADHENTAPAACHPTESKINSEVGGGAQAKPMKQALTVSTQVNVSSPNELSCPFCYFLKPSTKHICGNCQLDFFVT